MGPAGATVSGRRQEGGAGQGPLEAKGINFRSFFGALAKVEGAAVEQDVRGALGGPLRDALDAGRLDPGGWYPIEWYRQAHATARAVSGRGVDLARAIGFEAATVDFGGVYRALVVALTPTLLVSRAPRVFGAYYRPGSLYVVEARRGFVRVRWGRCVGFDAAIWQDMLGGCEALLFAGGGREVRLELVDGGGDGDAGAEAVGTWR